ncbi:SPOR domain-containing protein [Stenotrophomonas cyclobalanopsidis]|uniref:SPOR domain-containing protein n=1 Tax=Stenotrophomonas cyclobalanopsidis TaxID=2771362 RepID=A0ABQ6SXF6_9GAMM|nr:SPOR domain-containing protein [Stenotrophomonas cyclobalanopsidis]KAA8995021.1 SPOR domain-containing protein [Stenotrophomonas cyclobalanopsidis]
MLTRALIVVLAILNVGVASWWLLRSEPSPATPPQPATGVAELRWLPGGTDAAAVAQTAATAAPTEALQEREAAPSAAVVATEAPATTPPADAAPSAEAALAVAAKPAEPVVQKPVVETAAVEKPAAPPRCVALGPFADRAAAVAAQGRAGKLLAAARLREQPAASGSTRYRVLLPAAASREDAQATVKRIVAAGLNDYYIISQGEESNAIALGQYRNREGAERRIAAVQAAGFQPRLVASGDAGQWWLEGQLAAGSEPAQAQQRSGAAQQRSLECTRLR